MEDLIIPNGIDEIIATYGDIKDFIGPDGTLSARWAEEYLGLVALPFKLKLSWDHSIAVDRIRCHHKIMPLLRDVLEAIDRHGLREHLQYFGGCFEYRAKRRSQKISLHAWGVALDFNPEQNPQGTKGNMDPRIVTILEAFGATWGGRWKGRNQDPMHFQFASGY